MVTNKEETGKIYEALCNTKSVEGIPHGVLELFEILWEKLGVEYEKGLIPYLPDFHDLEKSIIKLKEIREFGHAQTPKWGANGITSKAMHESLYLLYEGDALKIVKNVVREVMHYPTNKP